MKLITAGLTSAILAAGAAGSVQAYRVTAEPAGDARPASSSAAKPRTVVQWAPCQPPSRLENDTCVTDVVRTVVRPAPPAERPETPDYSDDYEAPPQSDEIRTGVIDDERDEDREEDESYRGDSDDDESYWGYRDDDEREDDEREDDD